MRSTLLLTLFTAGVASALSASAAEPLPKGAKLRLGSTLLRDNSGWSNGSLSPDGQHLLLQTSRGIQKFALATGEADGTLGSRTGTAGRYTRFTNDLTRAISIGYSDVAVWDVASGKTLASLKRPLPFGESVAAITESGKIFAVGANQDFSAKDKPLTALIWDVDKNEKLAEVTALQNQSVQVALSPDGKWLATWGRHLERNPPKEGIDPASDPNRIVQVWDAKTGKELSKLRLDGFGDPVALFSPDGQTFAVSTGSGMVRLLDPKTGDEKRRFFGRSDQGGRLAFSPDGKMLASAGMDGTVQIWNLVDGTRAGSIECPAGNVNIGLRGLVFTGPDRAVAWTAVGFTALAWELPSGKLLTPLSGHLSSVRSVAFPTEGDGYLTSGDDGQILRWSADGKTAAEVRLRPPGGYALARYPMSQVALSTDGKLAIGQYSQNGIFDVATGRQVSAPFVGLSSEARTTTCADGRTVLVVPFLPYAPGSTPKDFRISVWDLLSGSRLTDLDAPPCELVHAVVSANRTRLATITLTRTEAKTEYQVTGWDLKTGKKIGDYKETSGFANTHLAVAPDSSAAVAAMPSGKLIAMSLEDGKVIRELDTGRRPVSAHPAFTADGQRLAVAVGVGFGTNAGAEILLFDWQSGKPTGKFRGHSGTVSTLKFSKDGKTLATGSTDTSVLLWDVAAAEK